MNGYLLYVGPSLLDAKPIIVISTGFHRPSVNPKTGPMIQVFIMPQRTDPVTASVNGADFSVCGNCALRTQVVDGVRKRGCYVTPLQAPRAVYNAYKRGNYPKLRTLEDVTNVHRGLDVRLGAWGDPAAVPRNVLGAIIKETAAYTGYTHQWRSCDWRLRHMVMASVESEADKVEANKRGWRTFRVRTPNDPLVAGEITCPAAPEAGARTTCLDCSLCNGAHSFMRDGVKRADPRRDIAILAHGQGQAMFTGRLLPMLSTVTC